jgi:ribosomal protein S27AE
MKQYECSDLECGAVFHYDRQSCGKHVPPAFCPECGQATVIPAQIEVVQS